jgi:hypothetical protein
VDDNIREYVKFTVYNGHFYLDTENNCQRGGRYYRAE